MNTTSLTNMNIRIGSHTIGDGQPVCIVAEVSANHNQSFDIAVKTLQAIKQSGADAVKLQTYTPDTLTIRSNAKHFQIGGGTLWDGRTLYDLYRQAYTPWEWHDTLQRVAQDLGLIFFSTPFDVTAVDFLEKLAVPAYKIASFELPDVALISYAAKKKKPIILSTGMAREEEIADAIAACHREGNRDICLLKCTSAYPAPAADMNLLTIPDLRQRFSVLAGLSDHTEGTTISVASVALGACMIEKHVILDRSLGGPDAAFSLEPQELKELVRVVRLTEQSLGQVRYGPTTQEEKSIIFRRSLFAIADIPAGTVITDQHIRSIRPGYGLAPKHLPVILGKKAKKRIKRGTPLAWDLFE